MNGLTFGWLGRCGHVWQRWWRRIPLGLRLGLTMVLISLAVIRPGQALSVQINLTQPQLGDTISVVIPGSAATSQPTVTLAGKTYPTFAIDAQRYRALLPTTPLDRPGVLALQVHAGADSQAMTLTLRDRQFPTQRIWLPPGQDGNVSDYEYDRVDAFKQIVSPEKYWNGPFQRPNQGEVTTGYGVRRYYNGEFAQDYYHRGVDYAGALGSAVVAPAVGRVALIGYEKDGFKVHGNCIGLDHGQGVSSIFLHLQTIKVKPGELVQAGQTLGSLGSTGAATGPHLHWGLYVHGQAVDPVPWRYQGFE
jgi:murein DD-endopeptidase MepM/ murein hydrolase activator NlpD